MKKNETQENREKSKNLKYFALLNHGKVQSALKFREVKVNRRPCRPTHE